MVGIFKPALVVVVLLFFLPLKVSGTLSLSSLFLLDLSDVS